MTPRHHSSRKSLFLLAAALLAGVLFRALLAFPTHKYPADADALGSALCAFEVLRGESPAFMIADRLGSLGCHLTALLFATCGVSRASLFSGPLLVGCLLMPIWYLFLRELFDSRTALVAAPFLALPSPAFAFWLYMPNTYPETLLFCASTLWLAARLARGADDGASMVGFGLAAGLGWWNSLLSLSCTGPAAIWLSWRRPDLLRRVGFSMRIGLGFLLGAAPWLLFNLEHGMVSLSDPRVANVSPGWRAMVGNLTHVLTYDLPELVAGHGHMLPQQGPVRFVSSAIAMTLCAVAATVFAVAPLLRRGWRPAAMERGLQAPPWVLFGLITASVIGLKVLAAAGTNRGLTVRYVLPLYLIVPGVLAVFLIWVARRFRVAAYLLGGLLLASHLVGAELPGTAARRQWEANAAEDRELMRFLESHDIEAVAGRFWFVYPLNFLSEERILGLPLEKRMDLNHMRRRLPEDGVRWALLARGEDRLETCVRAAGLVGTASRPTVDNWLFIPAQNPPREGSRAFLEHLQLECHKRPQQEANKRRASP